MCDSCKVVHKVSVENSLPFQPILSALNTPTYTFTKVFVPILKTLTTHEFFHFSEEIVYQPVFFMVSLELDFPFANVTLEETIEIWTNKLFKESETSESLNKSEFKELLYLATKDLHFIFDETPNKQIDDVAMGSPLSPTLAKLFSLPQKN